MTRINPNKPLSDADVERLRAILESGRGGENCMTIEAVDGLFACLICSPEIVMPSQWMPVVWDGESPEYQSLEEANEIIELLMRMWQEVARTINEGTYGPMVTVLECSDGVDRTFAADWAFGFIEGMKFQEHYWLDTNDSDLTELLTPIVMLAKEGREEPDDGLLEDEVREDLIDMLPGLVIDLKNYWLEKVPPGTLYQGGIGVPRGASPASGPKPVPRTSEPGRNDPCPCGSGKKYKKCCGSLTAGGAGEKKYH
ncbi:MAG: UPF0149 family protein [Candidatus Latescibacteria bacterium]|nr:UPF0149 family protein [Candidatus Latescibacterota bacterium]NIO77924.1 UPF0149 family protein [Candidatus Latescibacterota bacterium]